MSDEDLCQYFSELYQVPIEQIKVLDEHISFWDFVMKRIAIVSIISLVLILCAPWIGSTATIDLTDFIFGNFKLHVSLLVQLLE